MAMPEDGDFSWAGAEELSEVVARWRTGHPVSLPSSERRPAERLAAAGVSERWVARHNRQPALNFVGDNSSVSPDELFAVWMLRVMMRDSQGRYPIWTRKPHGGGDGGVVWRGSKVIINCKN